MEFAREFADRMRSGTAEIVVLSRNSTETRWWQELSETATAICCIRGRGPKVNGNYPTQGQIALYYGTDVDGFRKAWAERGVILH